MKEHVVSTVALSWERSGRYSISDSTCNRCNKKTTCLCCDTSDGEYGEASVCLTCVCEAFAQYHATCPK